MARCSSRSATSLATSTGSWTPGAPSSTPAPTGSRGSRRAHERRRVRHTPVGAAAMSAPVVVTGAGQGIGRSIALAFAAGGARVALAARSVDRLERVAAEVEAAGGEALAVPTDVGDPTAVQRLAATVLGRWGAPGALVASAGVAGPIAPVWEAEAEAWGATLRTNGRGGALG